MHDLLFAAVISEDPECRVDSDCPSQLVCIRESCQNPCIVQNPCIGSQTCVVKESGSQFKSVACECPQGLIYGDNGECVKGNCCIFDSLMFVLPNCCLSIAQGENECNRNEDCRQSEVCHTGNCVNACLVFKCAPYATCATTVHDIRCTCLAGYTGDGRYACNLSKSFYL